MREDGRQDHAAAAAAAWRRLLLDTPTTCSYGDSKNDTPATLVFVCEYYVVCSACNFVSTHSTDGLTAIAENVDLAAYLGGCSNLLELAATLLDPIE